MRNCQYPHTLSALIQAAESPERNLFPRREFDVVNGERGTGEVFTAYLRPVLSLSAHFDDGLLVYPEITGLDASVFYHMSGGTELVAEKRFSYCSFFRFCL